MEGDETTETAETAETATPAIPLPSARPAPPIATTSARSSHPRDRIPYMLVIFFKKVF
jgi:hypothetical protein